MCCCWRPRTGWAAAPTLYRLVRRDREREREREEQRKERGFREKYARRGRGNKERESEERKTERKKKEIKWILPCFSNTGDSRQSPENFCAKYLAVLEHF